MKTLNKVMLLGTCGRDPELRSTGGGTLIATLSIATNHRFKGADGNWQDKTEWHNLKAFARTAEVIRDYVQKGSPIHVEGRLETESWDDKQSGQKRFKTVVVIEDLILLGGNKGKTVSSTNPAPSAEQVFGNQEDGSDEVPF